MSKINIMERKDVSDTVIYLGKFSFCFTVEEMYNYNYRINF